MPAAHAAVTEIAEHCMVCEEETLHTVHIEIRTESTKPENRAYPREPYRVNIGRVCEPEQALRMHAA